jgi:hypothetical protein
MSKIYRRQVLPPGHTGAVKPPYDLAGRSGERRFADTVTTVADEIGTAIVVSDANNEFHEFLGNTDTELEAFNTKVRSNPGATEEEYAQFQQDMLANIRKAGEKTRTGLAKAKIRRWYSANEKLLLEKSKAGWQAIETGRQVERFEANRKRAVRMGDMGRLKKLYKDDNLLDEGTKKWMLEADAAQIIDETVLREALSMPEEEALAHIDSINTIAKDRYEIEDLYGPNEIRRLKENYAYRRRAALRTVADQQGAAETEFARKLYDPKNTPEQVLALRDSISQMESFDADMISEWVSKANTHLDRLMKAPEKVDDGTYGKLLVRLNADPDSVSWDEITRFAGDATKYKHLVDEKEDKSSFLKSSMVQAWFDKLRLDFDPKEEPLLLDEAAESLRRFIIDWNTQYKKPPANKDIQEYYDTLVKKGWGRRLWASIKAGSAEMHPYGNWAPLPRAKNKPKKVAKRLKGESIEDYLRRTE